ncbi:unnamed protein product [Rotaria sp. Silwood2]|nr:unnamed protein product [Rotaria sp. Silwood2]CAF2955245.1 unnamed protein product [Rotaria sp. Silwood2]CAF3100975.1 unnamed protein product [Rotaria sp. Silwood2]CAF4370266.1 unnamed protein product [Rotaria sp. Silwood2]CAF4397482.1 unnamed protein product [Rotaria sp. Silwood2]
MKLFIQLAIICYLSLYLVQAGNQQRSVLLEDVKTLTLHKGQRTEARRVSSIPQLKCIGGSAKCAYEPDVVQCYNRGSNGIDIQWECTAEMPQKYKFGKLSVSCEGYGYPDDPYILAGSCGLEYNLELTDKSFSDSRQSTNVRHSSSSKFWPFLFKVALIVIVFFAIKSYLSGNNQTGGARPMSAGPDHRPPGGGGGGGWFSNFFPGGNGGFGNFFRGGAPGQGDARRRQPPPPGFRPGFTDYGNDGSDCTANQQQNTGTGGGANFLTGAALGALGGYVFGARNRQRDNQYMPGTANTGWFGTGTTRTTTDTFGSSPSSSSSSSHTSTGYGGTTRR